MKTMGTILCALAALLLLAGAGIAEGTLSSDSLFVRKVENLPDDFILGMDASSVLAQEASGVVYRDYDGNEQDVFKTLAESGVNCIRVRVWNRPYDDEGHGFGGGNCDIQTALEIGKRANACGMQLIVDFHYSDFWADPSKQMVPRDWKGMEIEEKTQALYEYTRDSLQILKDAGIWVRMVQIGNETNAMMCGEKIWFNIQYLMQAGAKAVREVYPEALVALHFTNPEKLGNYETYAKKLAYYNVDYDVFASSYYPYWHGTLENLASVLSDVAETYGKKVMVLETSYAYTGADTDFYGNTVGDGMASKDYPFTPQGQANSVRDIVDTLVNQTVNGIGAVYWEGTWNSVGTESWEKNNEKWEKYGSGWATKYAWVYDPNDAGKYYGGNAVDNQAMFDENGMPLESLKVFGLMKNGNEIEVKPDAIEEITLVCDINGKIELPETVNAVMNDDSKKTLAVSWNAAEDDLNRMRAQGIGKYEITGEAGGMKATLWLSLVEYNFLKNYSFEEGSAGWEITDLKHADELYVEQKVSDSLTGSGHMHFWSAAKNSVEFTVEQRVSDLPEGKYKFTVSIMGGDCGNTDIYAYVCVNDEKVAACPMKITSYGNWDTAVISEFSVQSGDSVRVGVYALCEGAGNGAWGKIDDALLNSVG